MRRAGAHDGEGRERPDDGTFHRDPNDRTYPDDWSREVLPSMEGGKIAGDEGERRAGRLREATLDRLNELRRGEMAAVEAYSLALGHVRDEALVSSIRELRQSHELQAGLLERWILDRGGHPSERSGAWGAFARLVQRGADLFGDASAISALEEGEDHGMKVYEQSLDLVDPETRDFVTSELLPRQRQTHDLCLSLLRLARAA